MMPASSGGMRLRPMTVGDIIDETIKLYRSHFLAFVTATGVFGVAQAVYSIALNSLTIQFQGGRAPSVGQIGTLLAIAIPGGILLAGGSLWSYAAVVRLAAEAILGRPLDVGEAYRAAISRTLSFIWVGILIGIPVVLLALTIIGIPFAIYLGLGWSLTYQAIMIEGLRGRDAMRRSSFLVGGFRWRLLGISLLMSILVSILASVPSAIVLGTVGAVSFARNPAGGDTVLQVVNALVGAAAQALFGSLAWIAVTILYYELRVRKEAFDLEQRAADEGPPASFPSV